MGKAGRKNAGGTIDSAANARSASARIAKVRARLHKPAEPAPDAGQGIAGPVTNLILADIALRGGSMLLRTAVGRGLMAAGGLPKARFGQRFVTTTLAKVATRSVPGAIVVGGGLLAKTLYDRAHRAKKTAAADGKPAGESKSPKGKGQ